MNFSVHKKNTEKIALATADSVSCDILHPSEVQTSLLKQYDLIGFGSGIYNFKHHSSLFKFIDTLPQQKNKQAFLFSTRAFFPDRLNHKKNTN